MLVAALPASAHVTVTPDGAVDDGYGKLVFHIPTESAAASTTKVSVALPADTPFSAVTTRTTPGWTVTTKQTPLPKPTKVGGATLTKAVTQVTWTAQSGQGIKPEQFDDFEISVGPFPKAGTELSFPAVQTYSDGSVVKWDQATPASGEEPEHPAPALTVAASTGDDHSHGDQSEPATKASAASDDGGSDTLSRTVGISALVVALIALGLGVQTRLRRG